jgi:hypothetical protein
MDPTFIGNRFDGHRGLQVLKYWSFLQSHGSNLKQLRLQGCSTAPNLRALVNLQHMVSPPEIFHHANFSLPELKSIAITTSPYFDPNMLLDILNMNNPNLERVRLLKFHNSRSLSNEPVTAAIPRWHRVAEEYAKNGIRLEEISGELVHVS